jgi:type I restriction enzyme S subunit
MAGEFELVPLGELCDPTRGITYGIVKVGDFVPGGVPVIRGGDIRDGRIAFDDTKRVSEAVSQQYRRTVLEGGEILINLIAEPGHTAIVPAVLKGANVSRDVGVIALMKTVDHRYVDYCLKSPTAVRWLISRLQGSVTQKINLATLRELPIPLPALKQQHAIADTLGALDDKIELNQRTNETLHAMARALFKSWFVDFDPVRAKAEGRDPNLPNRIAELFPARLVDFELGELPEGWQVKPLDEVARFVNGLALQKYPPSDGKSLPVIKIAQLRSRNTIDADRASADLEPDYIVQDGDILFSWSGSLECVLWAGGPGALNQHLFKVIPAGYPRWLCYHAILMHLEDFRHIAAGKATTMGHIQRHHLSDAKLAVPPRPLMSAAGKIMEPIVESLWRREVQSRTLSAIRNALLPKLISGELRFSEGERHVAEVAA